MGAPRVRGGMRDWERAWGPGEQHRIHRKNVGSWEEMQIPGMNAGRRAEAGVEAALYLLQMEALFRSSNALPASDGVIVQVPTNAPKDHAEDEQDSKEEQSHEDGLGHWGDQDLHGPAEGVLRGPEGGTVTRAVQAATCTCGEMP